MFIVPLSHASRESRQLSRLFFGDVNTSAPRSPALDVAESDTAYTVKLEVPGVAKEDLKVSVEGRRVSVQAGAEQVEEKAEGDRIVYRERSAARYARSFTLPVEVEQGEANAKLDHGVLTLTLPKRNARSAAQLTIN